MSVAAPTTTEAKTHSTSVGLRIAGFLGAIYVLASLAVVFYGVPKLWHMGVSGWLAPQVGWINDFLMYVAAATAAVVLAIFGMTLAGPHPIKGLRGAISFGIASIIAGFFVIRGSFMVSERLAASKVDGPNIISFVFIAACFFLLYKLLVSDRFVRWSILLETEGWFDTHSYKPSQGTRVRRLTIFGVIVLLGSGIYTMVHNRVLPSGDWTISLPMNGGDMTLLPRAELTIPLVLTALMLWFAWRVVNFPMFADFLIATEAEMNKVSWTPRARLIQDTIVVLVTVFLITLFLFLVDVFWGWFLSRDLINILPTDAATTKTNTQTVNKAEY